LRARVEELQPGPGQHLEVIDTPPSLIELAAPADLVISAAGTSLVELFCLGSAGAIVCVVDNQERGYRLAEERHLAVGLGRLDDLRIDPTSAVNRLRLLLGAPATRDSIRRAGWSAVDGRGRERVADALARIGDRLEAP
jgi:spore coat polysaccharide biosynthesis predicted glycosyltransferase SpsG